MPDKEEGYEQLGHLREVCECLGVEIRMKIFINLWNFQLVGRTVGMVAEDLSIRPSVASHQLKKMLQAGVVVKKESAPYVVYKLDWELIKSFVDTGRRYYETIVKMDELLTKAEEGKDDSTKAGLSLKPKGGELNEAR